MFQFVRHHKGLSLAFAVAFLVTLVFLVRLTASAVIWNDPARVDQPIAGWMTPRYVAKSWHVPPDVVADSMRLERDGNGRRTTLDQIAEHQGRELGGLIQELESAIEAFRAKRDE